MVRSRNRLEIADARGKIKASRVGAGHTARSGSLAASRPNARIHRDSSNSTSGARPCRGRLSRAYGRVNYAMVPGF